MTADVINLRRVRKDKTRKDRDRAAAENRAAFGRTKAEKLRAADERTRLARELDQAHIVDDKASLPTPGTHDGGGL